MSTFSSSPTVASVCPVSPPDSCYQSSDEPPTYASAIRRDAKHHRKRRPRMILLARIKAQQREENEQQTPEVFQPPVVCRIAVIACAMSGWGYLAAFGPRLFSNSSLFAESPSHLPPPRLLSALEGDPLWWVEVRVLSTGRATPSLPARYMRHNHMAPASYLRNPELSLQVLPSKRQPSFRERYFLAQSMTDLPWLAETPLGFE